MTCVMPSDRPTHIRNEGYEGRSQNASENQDYLKDGYEKIVRMEVNKMAFMTDPNLSALQKVQRVCQYVAEETEIKVIPLDDHELWKTVEPVAGLMVDLFLRPDEFDPSHYPDVLRRMDPEDEERGQQPCQTFYLRSRAQDLETAMAILLLLALYYAAIQGLVTSDPLFHCVYLV